MTKLTKRLKKARENLKDQIYSISDAIDFFKNDYSVGKAKFDESLDVVFKLGVDPKHSDQLVRGAVSMPMGLGKDVKVLVFVESDAVENAKKFGADFAVDETSIDDVKNGKFSFDVCISVPSMMPKIASLGKVLGPKGLMPNPKLGTVTTNIEQAIKEAKAGRVEFKVEKAGIIHAAIGKLSFDGDAVLSNFKAIYNAIVAAKPSGAKGVYVQKCFLGVSQGPSIAIDLTTISD